MWLLIESKFKRGHPSGIDDQKNKEIFPNPAITNVILAELSKKKILSFQILDRNLLILVRVHVIYCLFDRYNRI